MTTQSDFLTTQQSGVRAVNTVAQTSVYLAGSQTSPAYSSSVILSTQAGWVAGFQVIQAGSAAGYIYNSQTFSGINNSNALAPIQTTLGRQVASCNFNNGLVLVPGPGQLVSVTYSIALRQTA